MASIMCLFGRDVLLPTSLRPQRRVRLVWRAIYRVHVHFIGHSRFVQFRIYLFAVHNTLSARARARYASAIRRIEVLREYVYFLSFSIPLWIPIATIRPSQFPLCGHTVNTCSCPKRIVETTIMAIIRSEKITKMKWKRFFFVIIYRCPKQWLHIILKLPLHIILLGILLIHSLSSVSWIASIIWVSLI